MHNCTSGIAYKGYSGLRKVEFPAIPKYAGRLDRKDTCCTNLYLVLIFNNKVKYPALKGFM